MRSSFTPPHVAETCGGRCGDGAEPCRQVEIVLGDGRVGGVVDYGHAFGEGFADGGGATNDEGQEAFSKLAAHHFADVEMQGQRGVELVEHVEGLQRAAIAVIDSTEEFFDGLKADDGVHVGCYGNDDSWIQTREAAHDPA